jgi:O-antigen ligase
MSLAITHFPVHAITGILVTVVGAILVRLVLRYPFHALRISLFVILLAWTKFRYRDPMATLSGQVDWQIALELGLYALTGLVALRVWWISGVPRARADWVDVATLAYLVIVIASTAWSPLPRITLVRAIQLSIQFAVVLAIVRLVGREGLIRNLTASVLAYITIFGLIAIAIPGVARTQVVQGGLSRFYWFSMHPGSVAALAAVAALLVLSTILFQTDRTRRSWFWIPLPIWLVILVGLLIATRARGQTIAFVGAGSLLVIFRFARSWAVAAGVGVAVIAATLMLSLAVTPADLLIAGESSSSSLVRYLYRGQTASQLTTMSDRITLWQIAGSLIQERPILGHGYVSSRVVLLREVPWAAYAHNAWVQSLLDLGIIGMSLVFMLIVSPSRLVRERPFVGKGPTSPAILSITAFLIVSSIIGESFAGGPSLETLLLFVLPLGAARSPQQEGTGT